MKTAEELKALREEVEALNKKLADLNEAELAQVVGGFDKKPPHTPDLTFEKPADRNPQPLYSDGPPKSII